MHKKVKMNGCGKKWLAIRFCVPLLAILNLSDLNDSTLTKVNSGYITRQLYLTNFSGNNKTKLVKNSLETKI